MSELALQPGSLVFFIDESGDPTFRDPVHPLFAWAGCGMRTEAYAAIRPAWCALRKRVWPGRTAPVHATRLRNFDRKRSGVAVGNFLRKHAFARLAVIATSSTVFEPGFRPLPVIAHALWNRIESMVDAQPTSHAVILFESSQRDSDIVKEHFGPLFPRLERRGIQVDVGFMDKSCREPGMELADFVACMAGRHARRRLEGNSTPDPIIDAVLRPDDAEVRYLEITQVARSRAAAVAP